MSVSSTRFWSLMVPLTRYFPIVNDTIVTLRPFCERPASDEPTIGSVMAVASFAASAALRNPWGVIASSSCRRSAYDTPSRYRLVRGTGLSPRMSPRVVAAQNGRDVFVGHRRPAEKWIFALPARVVLARPLGVVVDRTRVVGNFVVRPIFGQPVRLADSRGPAAGGISDGLQIGAAHSLERSFQNRADILHRLCRRGSCRCVKESQKKPGPEKL